MTNNLTLLLLTDLQVSRLNSIGRTDITSLNNKEVPMAVKCIAMAELSKFGCEEVRVLNFTFDEWEALGDSQREYYRGFHGKTVGIDLFNEVKRYVRELLNERKENNVEC